MPAAEKDLDVRRHLASLLGQGETLHDFSDWFIDALRSIELHGSDHDNALAARVENRLGGYSGGYLPLDELMSDLREDADEFGVHWDRLSIPA